MDAYRTLECETARSLICENCVIATGGSVIYYEVAMRHLQSIARIMFLDVPVDEIRQRIGDTSRRGVVIRPGMTLEDLFKERRPLYRQYAERIIDCSGRTQNEILKELIALPENA